MTRVDYTDSDPELYALFAAIATGDEARQIETTAPESVAAAVSNGSERGVLYSALWDQAFLRMMLDAVLRRKRFRGEDGEFSGVSLRGIKGDAATLEPTVNVQPQANTSIAYGDRFMLKLYRRLEAGVDPEREIGQRLMAAGEFPGIAPVAGYLEYRPSQGEPMPLGILHLMWRTKRMDGTTRWTRSVNSSSGLRIPRHRRPSCSVPISKPRSSSASAPRKCIVRLIEAASADFLLVMPTGRNSTIQFPAGPRKRYAGCQARTGLLSSPRSEGCSAVSAI